jgi:acetyl-CoA/propionyl-CoA carboxylase biotin carboxyl carrier protein
MVAKLVVWDRTRDLARARMRRALDEMVVEGVRTLIPLHRLIMEAPEFARGETCAGLVEEVWPQQLAASDPPLPSPPDAARSRSYVAEVDGRRFDVQVHAPDDPVLVEARRRREARRAGGGRAAGAGTVTSPMQGSVLTVEVAEGDTVAAGQVIAIIEAMKMENEITAPRAGVVEELVVAAGQTVTVGQAICRISDG